MDDRPGGEAGVGLLGSVVGVTVFLVLLLFAVQLALNLYATTTVTSVTFDAARDVAGSDGGAGSTAAAEARARSVLDRFEGGGGSLDFHWDTSRADVVSLQVVASRPSMLPLVRFPFQQVTRTASVRWERPR